MPSQLEIQPCGDPPGFRVAGEIDMATASLLLEDVGPATSGAEADVVLDMGEVAFIDSAGLHAIVRLARMMTTPHRLVLARSSRHLRRLLALTGLDHIPEIRVED